MPNPIIDPATLTACAHAAHAFDRERLGIPVWDDLPPETHIEYHDLARAVLTAALTPRIEHLTRPLTDAIEAALRAES